jgi:O-antigen ligase
MAVLAASFIGQGLWVYTHELQYYGTAVLWIAIGLVLAVLLTGSRRDWVWLPATLALAIAAEAALTRVYAGAF